MTEASFPVPTQHFAAVLEGEHTEFLITGYDNRVMVMVTQLGRVGTVLQAKCESSPGSSGESYTVSSLLGRRDEPLLEICARRMMELLTDSGCRRPLLLTLGLKNHSMGTMKSIIVLVLKHPVW
uniref:Uncharacterized protein n=1 Tax=Polyblepharides amylifera TaxID=1486889 RepID=A0A6T5UGU5_9CHLO|mmetsp:Transcript_677/g.972  ORF Transcript_677/g.972 Transcript_677/m.972 type:complete len:124 (+) Transcript_677:406-777(+)